MIETTLVIDQNTSLRGIRVDGEDRFNVHDFIRYLCPGRNPNYAAGAWFEITSQKSGSNVPVPEYFYCKVDGKQGRSTPCTAIAGLQKLMFILGTRVSSECGNRALECFTRVIAGDRTSIREINNYFTQDDLVPGTEKDTEQDTEQDAPQGPAQQIALPGAWDPKDPNAYTVHQGALVSDILTGMLGPLCDENRDASHKLQLKIQELHAKDPARAAMKVEVWVFKGDGTMWVNTTSVIKYIYTGNTNHFARTQKSIFDGGDIPHKLLQVPGVRTTFLFLYHEFTGTKLVPSSKPPPDGGLRSWYKSSTSSTQYY